MMMAVSFNFILKIFSKEKIFQVDFTTQFDGSWKPVRREQENTARSRKERIGPRSAGDHKEEQAKGRGTLQSFTASSAVFQIFGATTKYTHITRNWRI